MSLFKELAGIVFAAAVAAAGATAVLPWFASPMSDAMISPGATAPWGASAGRDLATGAGERFAVPEAGKPGGHFGLDGPVVRSVATAHTADPAADAMASPGDTPSQEVRTAAAEPGAGTPPEPADPRWVPTPRPELVAKADALFDNGDVAGARLWLDLALEQGDADAAYRLAETYDPAMLAEWRVVGVASDSPKARTLYRRALDGGVDAARERLERLDR